MNRIGILICGETVGGIRIGGKKVTLDSRLTSLVSASVSGDSATISANSETSITAIMVLN